MRYKRFKGSRRRSKVVKMTFQSFVDISTQADNMQIISVNAGGRTVLDRLAPFFSAFKNYKLGNVSIKLIPASTLPVDPTGLSYEAGENTVDPRDQLTPGMCRITNGEDILENITGMSGDNQRKLYNNMLLDTRWFKWMLQSGVKRSGKPRYWQIGQLHQDKWPGAVTNLPLIDQSTGTYVKGTVPLYRSSKEGVGEGVTYSLGSSPYGLFQTGRRGVLGWLPTDGLQTFRNGSGSLVEDPFIAAIPEIELFKILMPPMHKTNYYYRMFVTETVFFKDPIVMNLNGYRPLDVFHATYWPAPKDPNVEVALPADSVYDLNTGGNDGSS